LDAGSAVRYDSLVVVESNTFKDPPRESGSVVLPDCLSLFSVSEQSRSCY